MAYLPGDYGARAIADVLSGDFNPSGRLPFTWPRHPSSHLTHDCKHTELTENGFTPSTPSAPAFPTPRSKQQTSCGETAKIGDIVTVEVTLENTGTAAAPKPSSSTPRTGWPASPLRGRNCGLQAGRRAGRSNDQVTFEVAQALDSSEETTLHRGARVLWPEVKNQTIEFELVLLNRIDRTRTQHPMKHITLFAGLLAAFQMQAQMVSVTFNVNMAV